MEYAPRARISDARIASCLLTVRFRVSSPTDIDSRLERPRLVPHEALSSALGLARAERHTVYVVQQSARDSGPRQSLPPPLHRADSNSAGGDQVLARPPPGTSPPHLALAMPHTRPGRHHPSRVRPCASLRTALLPQIWHPIDYLLSRTEIEAPASPIDYLRAGEASSLPRTDGGQGSGRPVDALAAGHATAPHATPSGPEAAPRILLHGFLKKMPRSGVGRTFENYFVLMEDRLRWHEKPANNEPIKRQKYKEMLLKANSKVRLASTSPLSPAPSTSPSLACQLPLPPITARLV